jgi:hypothetical protein
MKVWNVAGLVGLLGIAGCGASGAAEPTVDDLQSAMQGYSAWDQIAPWVGVQESGEAHGAFVQIWWNTQAVEAIEAGGSGAMPFGSLIVKEGYGSDDPADLAATTVMWKVEDYGWFWARFNAAGEATVSGRPDACVNCHAGGDDSMLAVRC